jgi:hypothetical protein
MLQITHHFSSFFYRYSSVLITLIRLLVSVQVRPWSREQVMTWLGIGLFRNLPRTSPHLPHRLLALREELVRSHQVSLVATANESWTWYLSGTVSLALL